MNHAFITIAIPIPRENVSVVEVELDHPKSIRIQNNQQSGNPAGPEIRDALRGQGIHFMSMTVLNERHEHEAYLVLEASADGTDDHAIETIAKRLELQLLEILKLGGHTVKRSELHTFLKAHQHHVGQTLFSVPGVCFSGTPGMTVKRILDEYHLSRIIRAVITSRNQATGVPGAPNKVPPDTALGILKHVRKIIAAGDFQTYATFFDKNDSVLSEPQRFLPYLWPDEVLILQSAQSKESPLLGLVNKGILTFFWPYFILVALVALIAAVVGFRTGGFFEFVVTLLFSFLLGIVAFGILIFRLYRKLRSAEDSDMPDNSIVDSDLLESVTSRENMSEQNHLSGVYQMKPGLLRNFALRLAFWTITQLARNIFRPGFLATIGTIHFARWILLPKTKTLLFFSNYGGSWESYLEDFITRASKGLTGIWSNTVGFPKTRNLISGGAADGDRFKRWARRQQRPTRFWYSAYPYLTTGRIRTNAAIRHGLVSASTEDEAAAWLSLLGSNLRLASSLETNEIQSIVFGGMKKLTHAAVLLFELPADRTNARSCLLRVNELISFGDSPPKESAQLLALTATGLKRLGLSDKQIATFPIAFRQGMSVAHRASILGDTGEDKPDSWWWGSEKSKVDAVFLLYNVCPDCLKKEVNDRFSEFVAFGGREIHRVMLEPTDPDKQSVEAFGFVDGISQPIIRGTQRWRTDDLHVVESGEFILGYPDNRGYLPLSPSVNFVDDPNNILPVSRQEPVGTEILACPNSSANLAHDFGMNGTYLVIRQLEQEVDRFNNFLLKAAKQIQGLPGTPKGLSDAELGQWIAAKMVGRWRDGTSLVRSPFHPRDGWGRESDASRNMKSESASMANPPGGPQFGQCPVGHSISKAPVARHESDPHPQYPKEKADNDFLLGQEDPDGHRCPFSAHIRRTNPRDSFAPGSKEQLAITNRHRILRVGRKYKKEGAGANTRNPGLMFMCLNADIERQFEFIQQTWVMERNFHGLDGEVDSLLGRGRKGGRLTIPTSSGPIAITGIQDFITVRGGGYFFLPSRRALRFLVS